MWKESVSILNYRPGLLAYTTQLNRTGVLRDVWCSYVNIVISDTESLSLNFVSTHFTVSGGKWGRPAV